MFNYVNNIILINNYRIVSYAFNNLGSHKVFSLCTYCRIRVCRPAKESLVCRNIYIVIFGDIVKSKLITVSVGFFLDVTELHCVSKSVIEHLQFKAVIIGNYSRKNFICMTVVFKACYTCQGINRNSCTRNCNINCCISGIGNIACTVYSFKVMLNCIIYGIFINNYRIKCNRSCYDIIIAKNCSAVSKCPACKSLASCKLRLAYFVSKSL